MIYNIAVSASTSTLTFTSTNFYLLSCQGESSYGYSTNGFNWTLSPTSPYDCTLHYTDGTTGVASGCGNRPQIFWSEDGKTPLFLINGAMAAKPGGGDGTWTLFRPLRQ